MAERPKITLVGGGSVNWSPRLLNDMMLKEGLGEADYYLLDIDIKAAERVAKLCAKMAKKRKLGCKFTPTSDETLAFENASSIIITISTGGLDAMSHDLAIPEKYQIYQTVGDTVGPGGWSRALRNIPVFARWAKKINKLAPDAWVLNYTNPMSSLTKTLCDLLDQPVVGLCHGLYEVYRVLQQVFELESEDEIKTRFGGVNHFFWLLDMSIRGRDGYAMLRERLRGRNFSELVAEAYVDEAGFSSRYKLAGELLNQIGYLPYLGDRHTSEFIPGYLNIDEGRLTDFNLKRTTIEERRERAAKRANEIEDMIAGKKPTPEKASRETAADITAIRIHGGEMIDVINTPNRGQIANLPFGSVVETLGVVNSVGFTPLSVGELPCQIHALTLPHAINQDMLVEASFEGDKEKAMQALLADPLCSHLPKCRTREMGEELLKANARILPKPFGRAAALKI